ncbi:bla regulator protein blaR1 [Evansella caseinilytica]|uniref:Bla regulator protein blaR1 n=1 Tax=Evansella caseinilytica TaxID=1503961 RepID=A0A1H3SMW3_9BACI|nr:BlaR1 family beta-lactam sensor/signal transducer [Evansella caseinilytica]SDZ39050.1 bla regulator protein blaR1 [Evansella caseinilytica]
MGTSFFTNFFVSNLILSVFLCLVLVLKKTLRKQLTVSAQYHIHLIALSMLLIPFLPVQMGSLPDFLNGITGFGTSKLADMDAEAVQEAGSAAASTGWMQDFSSTLQQSAFPFGSPVLFFSLWIIGMAVVAAAILWSNRQVKHIASSLELIEDEELTALFAACKKQLRYEKKVVFGYSPLISTPITFGFFRPFIIIPDVSPLTAEEMKCVLLHELYHCKRKDIVVNYYMCFCRIVYWFNPLIWYVLKETKTEMEISCDYAVLKTLDTEAVSKYGEVILSFASSSPRGRSLMAASEISSTFRQLKRRIAAIANHQPATATAKITSIVVFLAIVTAGFFSIPFLSVPTAAGEEVYSFSKNNVAYEEDHGVFDDFAGSFVLYDANNDQYTIYNENESTARYSPASTYKIYSALFALESGVITEDNNQLIWDGTEHLYEEWNQDQDLYTAMKYSVNWYFQHLDRQTGSEQLQHYFQQIHYGNQTLSNQIDNYWLDSSLKISPVEQVEVLKKFYANEFAFDEANVTTVKESMYLEERNAARLFGKTGSVTVNDEQGEGWFVGYVEADDNTYFFAVHIRGGEEAGGKAASNIALSILENQGIY